MLGQSRRFCGDMGLELILQVWVEIKQLIYIRSFWDKWMKWIIYIGNKIGKMVEIKNDPRLEKEKD